MPPTGRFTVSLMLPVPVGAQDAPPAATHDHAAPLSALGNVSPTVAPTTADGPAFDATTVYVTEVPGTSDAAPSDFAIERSAVAPNVSVSVALLFVLVGSVADPPGETVAVLASVPVADAEIMAARVYVAVPPTGRLTVSEMLPVPLAAQLAPPEATHDHVAPLSAPGIVSDTVAPTAADGPAFDTTIVYVTGVPGTSVVAPSVFVTERSVTVFSVVVSMELLFADDGSVTPLGAAIVAVFDKMPDALGEMFAVIVYVAVDPTARLTVSLMLPVPVAAHEAPAVATHVQVAPDNDPGRASATVAPTTFEGPALEATIV